jgi:hypothetical protein
MGDWHDRTVSERLSVDSEFSAYLNEKPVSNQQWGLLMTAIEFDIENPEDPERARIVPDLSKIGSVLEPARDAGQDENPVSEEYGEGGGGLGGRIKRSLGLGGGDDPMRAAAEELSEEYARRLQTKLEESGKWERTCEMAAEE